MPSTLRCYICRTIDPIACPDYDAPDLIITGPLSVFLPNSQVFISTVKNDKGEFLHIRELSDELLILLQEKGEHNVNHP